MAAACMHEICYQNCYSMMMMCHYPKYCLKDAENYIVLMSMKFTAYIM